MDMQNRQDIDDDPYHLRAFLALLFFIMVMPFIVIYETTGFIYRIVKNEIRNCRANKKISEE